MKDLCPSCVLPLLLATAPVVTPLELPLPDHEFDLRFCGTNHRVPHDTYNASIEVTLGEGATCSAEGIVFDGSSKANVAITPWKFGGAFTFELFFKFAAASEDHWARAFDFGDSSSTNDIYVRLNRNNDKLQYGSYNSEGFGRLLSGEEVTFGEWLHVVTTTDEEGYRVLYQNGVEVKSQAGADRIIPSVTRAEHTLGQKNQFAGTIAYLRFWDSVVTTSAEEVAEMYAMRVNPTATPTHSPSHAPTMPPTLPPSPAPTPEPSVTSDCSIERCADLGWNSEAYGDPAVCGETDADVLTGGDCSGEVSFDEARALCQHAGARLCTSDELIADEARGTGCHYDEAFVW